MARHHYSFAWLDLDVPSLVLFGCKGIRQLQRQSILMQLNVIIALLLTNSNTFQKRVDIGLSSCNAERKNYNALFLWQHSPSLPPFQTNVAKHTSVTTQFVVMQMASSGNRVKILQCMLIVECHSGCVMLLCHFNDA